MCKEAKKKVVLMIPQLRHGGAERVVSRLAKLMKNYYDITVVVFDDTQITYEVDCNLVSLNAKPNPNSNAIKKFINFIKRVYLYSKFKKINHIDTTYSFGDTANLVNVFSLGRDKKVISIRGFKRIRLGKSLKDKFVLKPLSTLICHKSDLIVSVSELMSKTISREYNISPNKIVTSYNGYNIPEIIRASKEEITNDEKKWESNDRVIVTAGTFRSEKGYWHLLKAFSIVLEGEKNVKLLILGEDYQDNKKKVVKLADQLGISDKIIYAGYQKNPYKFFSIGTLYVLPSTFEGFPNAMVEAMCCNLPIIASDCRTGPREILAPKTDLFNTTESIEYCDYGVLIKRMNDVENYDSNIIEDCDRYLAKAIIDMLNNKELRLEYSIKSKQRAKEFNFDNWRENQDFILNR